MNRQLLSITKSWPLRNLKPGGTLIIQSPSSPLHLSLQVRIVPQKTREDGHITLHQILPRSPQNPKFADISKEVDMEISTLSSSSDSVHSHIQVLVDWKKNFTKQPCQDLIPTPPFSLSHRHASVVPSYHNHDPEVQDESDMSDSTHFTDSSKPLKSIQPQRFRYITDDGRFLVSLPTESSSSLSLSSRPSQTQDTLAPRHVTFEQVEYTDGITHLKDIHNHSPKRSNVNSETELLTDNSTNHEEQQQQSGSETRIQLTAIIPEKCNLKCFLCPPQQDSTSTSSSFHAGSIVMEGGKLEGEDGFEFVTMGGNIEISKLRGNVIHLSTQGKFKQDNSNISKDRPPPPSPMVEEDIHKTPGRNSNSSRGTIHVSKALEAQNLHVTVGNGGRFRAKLIHATKATIMVQESNYNQNTTMLDLDDGLAPIDISSIYTTQGAFLSVGSSTNKNDPRHKLAPTEAYNPRKVRVNSSHGHLSVQVFDSASSRDFLIQSCEKGFDDDSNRKIAVVDLGSINGSFDIHLQHHFTSNNRWISSESGLLSARIHIDSLSKDHISFFHNDYWGLNTELTLDRKLESELRLISTPWLDLLDTQVLLQTDPDVSAYLDNRNELFKSKAHAMLNILESPYMQETTKEEKRNRIDIRTDSFVGQYKKYSDLDYAWGYLENKSFEPDSRFDLKQSMKDLSRGKVSRNDAAAQALISFSSRENQSGDGMSYRPLMLFVTNGSIYAETLDWKQAISRRFGIPRRS